MRNIILFTAHSPLGGGGATILRSLRSELKNVNILWYYTSSKSVDDEGTAYLGSGLLGGSIFSDVIGCVRLLAGPPTKGLISIVDRLLSIDCDGYWIVSHNEGLRVALELVRRSPDRPVHLTVHDDWAGALCARSYRYRLFGKLADQLTRRVLRSVASYDVISEAMSGRYFRLSGHKGRVCHRYLNPDSLASAVPSARADNGILLVGHIGSIYERKDLWAFSRLLRDAASFRGERAILRLWGCHLSQADIPSDLAGIVEFNPSMPESDVVQELRKCDLLYAMYPLSKRYRIFAETSLPTKLSSYVQSGRPIFGHGPATSTLANFLKETMSGEIWTDRNTRHGTMHLNSVLQLSSISYENAREIFFGDKNVAAIESALCPVFD